MAKSQVKQEAERLSRASVEISGDGVVSKRSSDIFQSKNARKQIIAFKERYHKNDIASTTNSGRIARFQYRRVSNEA